jgi:ribosomal protein S21
MGKVKLVSVKVKKGEFGRALKLFKRKVKNSEHLWELKQRREYLKPAVKRRLIKQKAIRENQRMLKELRSEGNHQ